MSYNKVILPIKGINVQQRKLKVQYMGASYYVDAFPFQLRTDYQPSSVICIKGRDAEGRLVLKQTMRDVLESDRKSTR